MVILSSLAKSAAIAGIEKASEMVIEEFFKYFKNSDKQQFRTDEIEDTFREYMKIALQRNLHINSVAFRNQDKTLLDIYYPLELESDFFPKYVRHLSDFHNYLLSNPFEAENNKTYMRIDDNSLAIFDTKNRLMIIDHAGMGKSTISKYIFSLCVSKHKYVPIIIELRNLSKTHSVWDHLYSQLDLFDRHLEIDEIKQQLKMGGFMIIFDGFDEIKDSQKYIVADYIKDLMYKAEKNKYILTSRPDLHLDAFDNSLFSRHNIKPLNVTEAIEMLKRIGNDDDCSNELIKLIKEDSSPLQEFISNPLMVSLLYRSFSYHRNIPDFKKDFYQQVYIALFRDHDTTKGFEREKKSRLSMDEFESVLRVLGWFSFDQETTEFTRYELIKHIKEAIETATGVETTPEAFLYDLLNNVPLFEEVGYDKYKWCHKSFVEYFAARCIYEDFNDEERALILAHFSEDPFQNGSILTFYSEMDYGNCRDLIYIPYLEKLLSEKPNNIGSYEDKLVSMGLRPSNEFISCDSIYIELIANRGYPIEETVDYTYFETHSVTTQIQFTDTNEIHEYCIFPEGLRMEISCSGATFKNPSELAKYIHESKETLFFFGKALLDRTSPAKKKVTFESIETVLNTMKKERNAYKKGRFGIQISKK